ncbi:hypothetical protein M3Y99_00670000 [Aphelenchoides fujianensis]|nr:hypothetical protein M3Y99_00670000 [Aphelenchoides fujianensis]
MSCFLKGEDGRDVIDFNGTVVGDPTFVLLTHRIATLVITSSSICLNLIIGWVIWHSRNDVCKMRPVLLINCIIDCIWQVLNLILIRYTIIGFNRNLTHFNNGLHSPLTFTQFFVARILSTFTLLSMDFIPVHGDRPRGFGLFAFVGTCTAAIFVHFYFAILVSPVAAPTDPRFLNESMRILEHYGFRLDSSEIYGSPVSSTTAFTWRIWVSIGCYLIIVVSAVLIRRRLRFASISNVTRRLNKQLDKMLGALAITPVFSNIWPVIAASVVGGICDLPHVINWTTAILLVSSPLIYPCLTLYFIKPYRTGVSQMFRCRSSWKTPTITRASRNLWATSTT